MHHPMVDGIEIISLAGVPDKYWPARLFNQHVAVRRMARNLLHRPLKRPLILYNFLPLPYTLALQTFLQPDVTIYDAVFDFARVPDGERGNWIESEVVAAADLVFADSPYHQARMRALGANAIEILPAVDVALFEQSRSERVSDRDKPLCAYFGTISAVNQDIDLLRQVSHHFPLRLIGPADDDFPGFGSQTEWRGSVPFTELPELLKDVDVLLLPYARHDHIEGVIPAKTFECLATGKPTVAIGLPSLERFSDYFYLCNNQKEFLSSIEIAAHENPELSQQRIALAREHSWDRRFDKIFEKIDDSLASTAHSSPAVEPQVAYLSPSYHPYRVPVFEALNRKLNGQLTVFTLRQTASTNDALALALGQFPKELVQGKRVELFHHQSRGTGTALGVMLTPRFPFQLHATRPKIVISNNFNLWTVTSLLLGYRTIIFWEGTAHTERTVTGIRRHLRRWMAGKARGFVVNGELSQRYLIEQLDVASQHIITGGMSAEQIPDALAPRALSPREPDAPVRFLFVGRLIELKGVNNLIDAFAIANHRIPVGKRIELHIVGEGPEYDALQAQVTILGLADIVTFVGYVPPDNVWHYYEQADVFVLPTLQDNWPLVVAEAMEVGMPVLLSRYAGSVPDLIDDARNGYAFDPRDHEALAALLEWYVMHPDAIAAHGRKSQEIICEYTPEHAANAFYQAIAAVVEQDRQKTQL